MSDNRRVRIPGTARKDTCRGCGQTIYFVWTDRDRWSPTNPDGTSHFATCPDASFFRKPPERADHIPEEHVEEFEERVGILYYEAGLPLPDALDRATELLHENHPAFSQGELF